MSSATFEGSSSTLLLYNFTTPLLCYFTTLLLYYFTTLLLYCFTTGEPMSSGTHTLEEGPEPYAGDLGAKVYMLMFW